MIDVPPETPIDWDAIEAWLADIVPVAELAATPQDAVFHAEGDVWTHTRLALEALVAMPAYAAAEPWVRRILAAGVLLHDIGKPAMTRVEGDRITSRGHSARGDALARVALWRLGVPFAVREHICALVRSHQVPFFGITRDPVDAERLAIRMSLVTRNDWLAIVAEADGRGRTCSEPADQTRIIDNCLLWVEHCRELAVLDRPQPFASAHTQRVWFEGEPGQRRPELLAHDDTKCEATLMCGLPASGKDAWLADQRELPVISLDDLREDLDVDPDESQARVIAVAREQAREYLRSGTSFAWNATNLSPQLRAQLLALFRSYRARTRIVYVEATASEQLARNRARREPVPAAVIERMLARWTVPDPTEAHALVYVLPATPAPVGWPPQANVLV